MQSYTEICHVSKQIGNYFSDSPYCQVAYTGVSWHIFPTNGSKKSSKTEKFFNYTT